MKLRSNEPSEQRTFGTLDLRNNGPLKKQAIPLIRGIVLYLTLLKEYQRRVLKKKMKSFLAANRLPLISLDLFMYLLMLPLGDLKISKASFEKKNEILPCRQQIAFNIFGFVYVFIDAAFGRSKNYEI